MYYVNDQLIKNKLLVCTSLKIIKTSSKIKFISNFTICDETLETFTHTLNILQWKSEIKIETKKNLQEK